jgi:hypothetical protein
MNNRDTLRNIIRAIIVLLIQILVLKRIGLSSQWWWQHGQIFLYPIIILLVPFRVTRHYVLILGFVIGLIIDMFYDTVGVHAFALTGMAYARGILLAWLEPRGGYQLTMSPTNHAMGINWLMTYTSVSMFIFCFLYFIGEIFTFVYLGQILLKTLITFFMSMLMVMGYHFLFNPKR